VALDLSILYRGPLSSCNYDCAYCPFAKRQDDRRTLRRDALALRRFVHWALGRTTDRLAILFTPWGEGLIRRHYRDAIVALSHAPHIWRVAIQTNLSCAIEWMADVDKSAASFWCSYHPSGTTRDAFLAKCAAMDRLGVAYCVGMVGHRSHFSEIEALRRALPEATYLWINAYKNEGSDYYRPDEVEWLASIDPLFELNLQNHRSLGLACRAGETIISVLGSGEMRRCSFVPERIGNIYDANFAAALRPRACPKETCACHIGYAQMPALDLDPLFGGWALGRLTKAPLRRQAATTRLAQVSAIGR
jgi:MoaA/NifB/PqqE/SkfB family radical SAM enzyme